MISFITGTVEYIFDNSLILQNNGIGYSINVTPASIAKLPNYGEEVRIYTRMAVKEDGISLYGFLSPDETFMFDLLLTVSGIGPKAALALLGSATPAQLTQAIISGDVITLSKAPGIGKKTAGRLVLELKDKFSKSMDKLPIHDDFTNLDAESAQRQEATEALTSLGFSRLEAVRAVMEVTVDGMTSEQIIKAAIKKLSQ